MGIPRFAYRMRDYARIEVFGPSEPEQPVANRARPGRRKLAIVDGPSFAHSLILTNNRDEPADRSVAPGCNYSDLGKAAVEWLDGLQSHGFEVEGIYFDGALPVHKKQTRTSRLQQHVDNLTQFKRVHDEVEKAKKHREPTKPASDWRDLQLKMLRNDLATPPFLVFAIVEALLDSHYAARTWLVPGEADPYCATAALEAASAEPDSAITIFTNDSDLIVYPSRDNIQTVIIDTIEKRFDEGRIFLRGSVFRPCGLARMVNSALPDLIRPAYEMLDPDVSFKEAIVRSKTDPEVEAYHDFTAYYSLEGTFERLRDVKIRTKENQNVQIDSRVSELYHRCLETAGTISAARKERMAGHASSVVSNCPDGSEIDQIEPLPANLDMYLPMLFEDPTRSSAWKVGSQFRSAAGNLVLRSFDLESLKVLEYRKSGNNIRAISQASFSAKELRRYFEQLTIQIRQSLQQNERIENADRWRWLTVQLALSDISSEGITLPNAQDIASVLDGESATTWRLVHLQAQYQAEYYSVRMLKQVLSLSPSDAVEAVEAKKLNEWIDGLPGISQFFDVRKNVDEIRWLSTIEHYLAEIER